MYIVGMFVRAEIHVHSGNLKNTNYIVGKMRDTVTLNTGCVQ